MKFNPSIVQNSFNFESEESNDLVVKALEAEPFMKQWSSG